MGPKRWLCLFKTPKPFPNFWGRATRSIESCHLARSDAAADGGWGRPQRGSGAAAEVRRFPGGDGWQWQPPQQRGRKLQSGEGWGKGPIISCLLLCEVIWVPSKTRICVFAGFWDSAVLLIFLVFVLRSRPATNCGCWSACFFNFYWPCAMNDNENLVCIFHFHWPRA